MIHKEHSTGEGILLPDERGMIEQAKFAYSTLRKAFEKQTKIIKDQEIKYVDALKALTGKELELIGTLFPKYMSSDEIKNEKKKWEEKN